MRLACTCTQLDVRSLSFNPKEELLQIFLTGINSNSIGMQIILN